MTDVRSPSVIGVFGDESLSVASVTMQLVAGGVSQATATLHDTQSAGGQDGSAIDALNIDHAQRVGALQTAMFQQRTSADSSIVIADGTGKSITFQGLLSSPTYTAGVGHIGNVRTMVHESAVLSGFRGSIYVFQPPARLNVGTQGTSPMTEIHPTTPVMSSRFMEVLEYQTKLWIQTRGRSNDSPISLEQKIAWHKVNQSILPMLAGVMGASAQGTTWASIAGLEPSDQDEITAKIRDVITQQSDNFFSNLGLFEEMFQCMFVPNFSGDAVGHFVSWEDIARSNPQTLRLPPVEISFSGGQKRMLPITHVFVNGSLPGNYRAGAGTGQSNVPVPVLVAYPDTPYSGGQVINVSGPPWLTPAVPDPSKGLDNFAAAGGLDLEKYVSGRLAVNKLVGSVADKKKLPVLLEWAKNTFAFSALSNATATVPIPLDVSILPGRRMAVLTSKGEYLFAGFLAQVSHQVSLEGRGQASTTLSFTHVEAGGFVLPK